MPSEKSIATGLKLIESDKSKILNLKVGSHENVEPGQYIPRADAQQPPQITYSGASPDKTYLIVTLDIDAPFPSFGVLGPILHWIQPDVKASELVLKTDAPFIANYIGPAPPPGSGPHRYVFFLFEQPAGFDAKKYAPANGKTLSNWHRMRYNLDAWSKEIGLGDILALNYFKSN
ncbi:phosphatidylethanolamine-binding protein [Penicillium chermesinum]|uniref:Phosphatidylethanolamine-binding protein n=1 Tax=Penicillium chermesinum TaxID=63820 RepID=A0A9W9TI47_9EURO|nr:phosphatidylethanolamine-binding protein [Penicillium chermesinum]KAJ5223548.1 phosphatidylethanolamine-binding protein [Penicillium chermesinum]KAJ6155622.1 phosphatidylethanolamine-binding protein [Penicillium chermesinum]